MAPAQQKRSAWLWTLLVVAAVVFLGAFLWKSLDVSDRVAWSRFRTQLADANVTTAAVGGTSGNKITLSDADRKQLLAHLRAARFDKGNREGYGPTPQVFLYLTLANGTDVTIGMLGPTSFELAPRHLDPRAQFLIKSDTLGLWLMQRFKGPTAA